MVIISKAETTRTAKEAWSVVVICEDESTHARAVSVCKRLTGRFLTEIEFEFRWWQFSNLCDPANALDAAAAGGVADMIIVASHVEGELPDKVRSWFTTLLEVRKHREGALVALIGEGQNYVAQATPKHVFLRNLARHAEMDFLSEINFLLPRKVPESMDWLANRAGQVGSTLDDILRMPDKPPQLGMTT